MPKPMNPRESELLGALAALRSVVRDAIQAGDWKVDGACDPECVLRRADRAIAQVLPQPIR